MCVFGSKRVWVVVTYQLTPTPPPPHTHKHTRAQQVPASEVDEIRTLLIEQQPPLHAAAAVALLSAQLTMAGM